MNLDSEGFNKSFREQVEKDTWDKGFPMIYSKDGWIIEHWKDGTIKKIQKVNENTINTYLHNSRQGGKC